MGGPQKVEAEEETETTYKEEQQDYTPTNINEEYVEERVGELVNDLEGVVNLPDEQVQQLKNDLVDLVVKNSKGKGVGSIEIPVPGDTKEEKLKWAAKIGKAIADHGVQKPEYKSGDEKVVASDAKITKNKLPLRVSYDRSKGSISISWPPGIQTVKKLGSGEMKKSTPHKEGPRVGEK